MQQDANSESSASTPTTEPRLYSPAYGNGSEETAEDRRVRPWSKDEHARFLVALEKFRTNKTEKVKKNGKRTAGLGPGIADVIALIIKTRDAAQVRSHAQKHFQRLRREAKTHSSGLA
eukprot:3057850-Rhodomonas_salina.1